MSLDPESPLGKSLADAGVIAVLVIEDAARAVPLAEALLAGGIRAMELTLRTPAALDALRAIRSEVPDMVAGVGTVLTPGQVDEVVAAGGAFAVAPGCNPAVIQHAREAGLPFGPGIATASDIEAAVGLGCRLLKFFPAEAAGGLPLLNSMATPYAHLGLRYIPLGGIKIDNLAGYLGHPFVHAVGGSWLAPRDQVAAGNWEAITAAAREATDVVSRIRAES